MPAKKPSPAKRYTVAGRLMKEAVKQRKITAMRNKAMLAGKMAQRGNVRRAVPTKWVKFANDWLVGYDKESWRARTTAPDGAPADPLLAIKETSRATIAAAWAVLVVGRHHFQALMPYAVMDKALRDAGIVRED